MGVRALIQFCFFYQEDNDRDAFFFEKKHAFYWQQLKISAKLSGVAIHAFVLMANHVHLLVAPSAVNACANMMQSLGRKYVQYP
jgi:putative transposase